MYHFAKFLDNVFVFGQWSDVCIFVWVCFVVVEHFGINGSIIVGPVGISVAFGSD